MKTNEAEIDLLKDEQHRRIVQAYANQNHVQPPCLY